MSSGVTYLWACDKTIYIESEFQHKGNKQTKTTQILSKILQFSRQEQIQKMKLFKY